MAVAHNYGQLPDLVIDQVFQLLSHQDLKSIMLVCRAWWDVGRLPKFWTWVRLKLDGGNLTTLPEIICMARLTAMKSIKVEVLSNEMLRAIKVHPGIEEVIVSQRPCCNWIQPCTVCAKLRYLPQAIKLKQDTVAQIFSFMFEFMTDEYKLKKLKACGIDLATVDPVPLARAVNDMEEVDLSNCNLSLKQSREIFKPPGSPQFFFSRLTLTPVSRLKKLNISGNELSKSTVSHGDDPESLARAVHKLEEVNLSSTSLNIDHVNALFNLPVLENSSLKKLSLRQVNLSPVDPESLAKSINMLEEVDLSMTNLQSAQTEAIFRLAANATRLKILIIQSVKLSSTDPENLAMAINKMEEVNLSSTKPNNLQGEAIFRLAAEQSKLRKLSIREPVFSLVCPESLAKAVTKMEVVLFENTNLNSEQTKAIFKLAADQSRLRQLNLTKADFSLVDPESLGKSVSKMEQVDLSHGLGMTSQHTQAIFEYVATDSKLTKLLMREIDLSHVDSGVLSKAVSKMEIVDLNQTNLNTVQCNAIFVLNSSDSKLTYLRLEKVNLSAVDPELLAKAVNNVGVVGLSSTSLTTRQLDAILVRVKNGSKLKYLNFSCNGSLVSVDTESLVGAIANLKKVILWDDQNPADFLSTQQREAINNLRDKLQFRKPKDWLPGKDFLKPPHSGQF